MEHKEPWDWKKEAERLAAEGNALSAEHIGTIVRFAIADARDAALAEAVEVVNKELVKNQGAKCQIHSKPRTEDANDYDCSDLHTGYEEAASDIRNALSALRESK